MEVVAGRKVLKAVAGPYAPKEVVVQNVPKEETDPYGLKYHILNGCLSKSSLDSVVLTWDLNPSFF